ncbi:cysteine desulfurase [Orenia metallireducens]|jgi:cysteine desulfurase|uniref:Cysteine desulfurase n=1 Tax=Orenia metallireducens TaxID=1413210 RepID=A0A1C0A848_9FIRM|nr:cysteine desulfurase family protein [Orenia metallireducens]OCL26426.1 cysteine desulfurase [Orenia metallireducens]
MEEIYLDNAATTKPYPEVVEKMKIALTTAYGNPSSLHRMGIEAEKIIKEARKNIASKLDVSDKEIYFTSGGTESNNLAIKGAVKSLKRYGKRLITSSIEHPSVLNVFKKLESEGYDVKYLQVNDEGIVDLEELKKYLNDETILVSIMGVNNETGSIQPLAEIGELVSQYDNLYFHVDGVQTFGKVDISLSKIGIDLYSISAHKINGPKGTGALYIKKGTRIDNLISGSKQESGIRPGTENVPGIAGFGQAVELLPSKEDKKRIYQLKKLLVTRILDEIDDTLLNGPSIHSGAVHIANISFAGVKGEVLIHTLERDNIYLSTGAACSSRQDTPSYVLEAMKVNPEMIEGAIRFSLSTTTTEEEINYTVDKLKDAIKMLRKIMQR